MKMREDARNVFDILKEGCLYELAPDHRVVGGVALNALIQADEIDWNNHRVDLGASARLSNRRENGTLRDLDMFIPTTDVSHVKSSSRKINECLGGSVSVSMFRLRPYGENKSGFADFLGGRYIQELPNGDKRLFWRLSGIQTEIPMQALEPWQVLHNGERIFDMIGPVAQLGAYINRSITGVRPKDTEKVTTLKSIVVPGGRVKDVPIDYREQHFAFLEQAGRVARARQELGLVGIKARALSLLERQDWVVELAQGKLDSALSFATGKQ